MDGKKKPATDRLVDANRLLRIQMDVRPVLSIGPDLDHAEVEGAILLTDERDSREEARVAAVEYTVARPGDHPRRPQRLVALEHPPRIMSRRRSDDSHLADMRRVRPIEFRNPAARYAPRLEMGADAQRSHELHAVLRRTRRQGAHGIHVEVIVVIVRQDHDVERRQVLQGDGWRVEPLGTDELRG